MTPISAARAAAVRKTAVARTDEAKTNTDELKAKARKHKFLVVEVSRADERRYPHTLFACETLEEALRLCKQMNADAGFQKFAVRGNADTSK